MLFYMTWPGDASLLVDVASREIAIDSGVQTVGSEPHLCRLFPPGTFAVRCYFEDDEDDDAENGAELITLEPLEHVYPLLQLLEDEETELPGGEPPAPEHMVIGPGASSTAPTEAPPACPAVGADLLGDDLACERDAGHEPPHRSGDYEWEDEVAE